MEIWVLEVNYKNGEEIFCKKKLNFMLYLNFMKSKNARLEKKCLIHPLRVKMKYHHIHSKNVQDPLMEGLDAEKENFRNQICCCRMHKVLIILHLVFLLI